MKIKTAAKINLALDVCGIMENGYHSIKSVFQTVGLYDDVIVELNDSGDISVSCELPESFAASDPVPCGEKNIAYKAARLFLDEINSAKGCDIFIKKGIPSQAGMGGGSTDAAAVIHCLNELTESPLDKKALTALGKRIGADVPFFFTGGTAYVSGIGEEIVPLPDYSGRILVIAKGSEGISTAEAYRKVDSLQDPVHPDSEALARAIKEAPETAYEHFGNIFEDAAELAEVNEIKKKMLEYGAISALMTGSGSAVFGLFESEAKAKECADKLEETGFFSAVCSTVSSSFIEN